MKLSFVSQDRSKLEKNRKVIEGYKSCIDTISPDVVIAIGGDGTYLAAEHYYPGIPKLLIREESICKKCSCDDLEEGLKKLTSRRFSVKKIHKLVLIHEKNKLKGVNDVVVRNIHPTHAIRFRLWIERKQYDEIIIGDGIVVSTAFGSEGYFHSITGKHFEAGIGIAFNNTTRNHKPIYLEGNEEITMEITRGWAHAATDNNPKMFLLKKGDKITIRQSMDITGIVYLGSR